MAEYIKRYDAMKICQNYSTHCFSVSDAQGQDIADKIEEEIVEIPTADVVEVKHGEWIIAEECKTPLSHGYIRTEKTYICPFCTYHFQKKMKFCGECGAKMDGRSDT